MTALKIILICTTIYGSTIGQDEAREPVAVDPEDLVEEYFPGLLVNTTNTRSSGTVSKVIYKINTARSIDKLSSYHTLCFREVETMPFWMMHWKRHSGYLIKTEMICCQKGNLERE